MVSPVRGLRPVRAARTATTARTAFAACTWTSSRATAGAGSALDALSGEQAGELQAFAGLHGLDEHVLESVHRSLSLSLGQVGLLGDLRDEIRLVVCHKASFLSQGIFRL